MLTETAVAIDQGMVAQNSQALQIQNYCNSVLQQVPVDFGHFPNLHDDQTQINAGLVTAKGHANQYLNTIQPEIITNITNISNYYSLYQTIPVVCPKGATKKQWLDALAVLRDEARKYQEVSSNTRLVILGLHDSLVEDSSNFQTVVTNLNSKVGGDNGVLNKLSGEIDSLNAAVSGAIAGIVAGGFLVVGGAFVTAIGAVADLVTAGTSTPVVIGGVAMMVAGGAGIAAGATILKNSLNSRQKIYQQRSTLTAEVNIASAIKSGFVGLQNQAQNAVTAASQMSNSWDALSSDLDMLSKDISTGIRSTDAVREMWLTAANSVVKHVITDINLTKAQMAGVSPITVPSNTTLADYVNGLAA